MSASSSSSDSMTIKSLHVFFITLLGTSPLPSSTALTDTSLGDGSRTRGRILSNSCLLRQHNLFQFPDGPPDVDSAAAAVPAGRSKAFVWTRERSRLGGLCADNWVEWRRGCKHWDAAVKAIVEPKRDKRKIWRWSIAETATPKKHQRCKKAKKHGDKEQNSRENPWS